MITSVFPEPELFLPGTGEPALRWGVLAPGLIAGAFTGALHQHTAQRAVAVASRSADRAAAFARTHGIPTSYDSYAALVEDPEVDVVYVAAPHSEHLALGLLAISAGKHVLIEKPIATTAADARTLVAAAEAAGVLLMEAMWSRYQPQASIVRQLVADGALGEVRSVAADHGQLMQFDPRSRLFDPELGGGALLDLGIYPIQLDSMVLGAPASITAIGSLTSTGVDAQATLVLGHEEAQSTIHTTLLSRTPTVATISGTEGTLEIAGPFHIPTSVTVSGPQFGSPVHTWHDNTWVALFGGLSWEATALARFVGEGRTESPLHTLAETVSILGTIDEARRQLGVPTAPPA